MPVTGECPDLLPHGWIVKKTSDKTHFYYYNYETGESTWTKPAPDIDVGAVAMAAAAAVGEKPSPKRSVEGDGSDRHNKRRKREQSSAPSKGASSTSAKDPTGKVRVMHILKKHNKSSRPSSWREEKITRSLGEAREELEGIRSMILEQEVRGCVLGWRYHRWLQGDEGLTRLVKKSQHKTRTTHSHARSITVESGGAPGSVQIPRGGGVRLLLRKEAG